MELKKILEKAKRVKCEIWKSTIYDECYYILKNKTGFAYGFGGSETPWNKGKTDLKETRPEIYKKGWETRKQRSYKNV